MMTKIVKNISDFIPTNPPAGNCNPDPISNGNKILLIEKSTKNVLASFEISPLVQMENEQLCYKMAMEYESYGIEVEIISPSSSDSLIHCLTDSSGKIKEYRNSVEKEWLEHD